MESQDPAGLHVPVLLQEVLDHLRPAAGKVILDLTLGMGGHSASCLERGASVVGVDRDPRARALAERRLAPWAGQVTILNGTFADVAETLAAEGRRFDGVLADIGVSSLQLDDPMRGFSIRSRDGADMRMGDGCGCTALELIDATAEDDLADLIYRYGEERLSRRIARALKRARAEGRCDSGVALAEVVRHAVPGHHQRHPALRTFQALRIAVNDELGQLTRLLAVLPRLCTPGGRAVVISFHSLEDRLVKESFREGRRQGLWADATSKVVTATAAEEAANPRSTPAKLRWAIAP